MDANFFSIMRRASIHAEIVATRKASLSSSFESDANREDAKRGDANKNEDANNNNDLMPEMALALVQPFFPKEWSKLTPKDVTIKVIA